MNWENTEGIDMDKHVGFVYKIINTESNKEYVGIKKLKKRIRRKPLKGKKRVRIDYVESDWKTYNSSSRVMQEDIAKNPDKFKKEIIFLAETVTQLKAVEAWYQLDKYMRGEWDTLVNEMINLRLRIPKSKERLPLKETKP